jgi:tetratricopeptide (TPR) repeat protein
VNRPKRLCVVSWLAFATLAATAEEAGQASTRTPMGAVLSNPELASLAGGKARPQQDVDVNVLVFFRPDTDYSKETLKGLAACEKRTAQKPVRWAAIVADRYPADQVKAAVTEAGILMPVLIDAGEAFSNEVAVAQLPAVAFTDKGKKLVAFQPFTKLNFCELVDARIRILLKEITEAEFSALADPASTKIGGEASVAGRHVKMAEMFLKSGNNDKALESARLAVQHGAALAAAHSVLGESLRATGNCKEAVAAFDKALALDPKDVRAGAGKNACAGKAP